MITVCQRCNAKLKIPDERVAAGVRRFKCPKCSEIIEIAAPKAQPVIDAMSIRCKTCGSENDRSSSYCTNCGAKLDSQTRHEPSNAKPVPSAPAQGPAVMPIVGKRANFTLFAVPYIIGLILFVPGMAMVFYYKDMWGWLFILASAAPRLFGTIYSFIVLYRCWALIEGDTARTTPGKAVGFIFIPLFGFYWNFVALYGLAKDVNTFLDRRNVSGVGISKGISLAFCILAIGAVIPKVGFVLSVVYLIMRIYLVYQWVEFNNFIVDNPELRARPATYQGKPSDVPVVVFALVGSLVGVAVLGIVAAIAIPGYLGYQKASKTRAVSTNYDTAYRLVQSEMKKCGTEGDSVTDDVLAALNAGDKRSPWDESVPAFGTSIEYRGQVAISETDIRSLCGSQTTVDVWADTDGDLQSDQDSVVYPDN